MLEIYELSLLSKLNNEEKKLIIERALRKVDESREITKAFIEENFNTDEQLNKALTELVTSGNDLAAARIRYLVAFKSVPNASKFIEEEIIQETKEAFSLSTNIKDQFKQIDNIKKLIGDKEYRASIEEHIEDLIVNQWDLDETSNEYLNIMTKAHLTYIIYDMLFTEEIDLYDLYAQYVKPPAPRFSVVLQENEYRMLELIRATNSVKANKSFNNTKIMSLLLESYYKTLSETYKDNHVPFNLIESIVIDKTSRDFSK